MGETKVKIVDLSQIRYTPQEGEIIQNSIDKKFYIYKDSNWMLINTESSGINMGLYDINKQIILQLPDLTDFTLASEVIKNFNTYWHNVYYMLYGKEISYFTVFKIKEPILFDYEVIDVIKNIGPVKAIDLTENGDAIEIWIIYNNEPTCLYLFPYDTGIVQVGE